MKILSKKKEIQIKIGKKEKDFVKKVDFIESILLDDYIIWESRIYFFIRSWKKGANVDYDFINFIKKF